MRNPFVALALGLTLTASPAAAQTVLFNDTFNSEGASLNYNTFANWNVTGQVDMVAGSNPYGITCDVRCVDLDGTTGPGTLTSKLSYSFAAGDVISFRALVSGSQRGSNADQYFMGVQFAAPTGLGNGQIEENGVFLPISLPATGGWTHYFSDIASSAPFAWYGLQFTAQSAGSVSFNFGTSSADNVGPVVDQVVAMRTSTVVPEPSTFVLLAVGFTALAGVARRTRRV